MAKIIGIDLGTSNTAAAVMEGGRGTIIPSAEGSSIGGKAFPSYVAFTKDGQRLVGEPARRQAIANPDGTVTAFKRKMRENYKYNLTYYHNPNRWRDNIIALDNPIRNVENWSAEIKYLNESNDDLSDDIKNLPNDTGGIYVFYAKGLNLSFMENYILYIGRCQYTDTQHIRKRAKEYYKDTRDLIVEMFNRWKDFLYYRYYPDTDNDRIKNNEIQLIRAILPQYNEVIPDQIDICDSIPAFS